MGQITSLHSGQSLSRMRYIIGVTYPFGGDEMFFCSVSCISKK